MSLHPACQDRASSYFPMLARDPGGIKPLKVQSGAWRCFHYGSWQAPQLCGEYATVILLGTRNPPYGAGLDHSVSIFLPAYGPDPKLTGRGGRAFYATWQCPEIEYSVWSVRTCHDYAKHMPFVSGVLENSPPNVLRLNQGAAFTFPRMPDRMWILTGEIGRSHTHRS